MAGLKIRVGLDDPVTLGNSGGWKALLAFQAPANMRYNVDSWGGYPMGTVNSDPGIQFRLVRGSAIGTGVAGTIQKKAPFAETPQGTAKIAAFSVEPTVGTEVLDLKPSHPQGGADWPAFERGEKQVGGGEIVVLQYKNDSGGAGIKCTADLHLEQ